MYGKFFARGFTHSMMGAGSHVFAVMAYVIAHTIHSRVDLNPQYLAAVIGDTEERMREAIEFLCRPDPRSSNPAHEGRRIVHEGAYQYFVPSHEIYRSIGTNDELRAANAQRVAEHRRRKKETISEVTDEEKPSKETKKPDPELDLPVVPPAPKPSKAKQHHAQALEVLLALNECSGKQFRPVDEHLSAISKRLNEPGVDVTGVKMMIARQCTRWGNTEHSEYLRPKTLFGPKFDDYYGNRELAVIVPQGTSPQAPKNVDHNQMKENLHAPRL
jgi:uncharacterized phage protein (TIGR02220 family)